MDPVELFTPEFKHDPFPTYRILRDHHPVYRDPRTGAWLLSRFRGRVRRSRRPRDVLLGEHEGRRLAAWAEALGAGCWSDRTSPATRASVGS